MQFLQKCAARLDNFITLTILYIEHAAKIKRKVQLTARREKLCQSKGKKMSYLKI